MRTFDLVRGAQATAFARGGPTLHVVNHPALDPSIGAGAVVGGTILVGFGQPPTATAYDGIVPPFSEALLFVPDTIATVFLAFLGSPGFQATKSAYPALADQGRVRVGVEFLPVCVPSSIRPVTAGGPPMVPTKAITGGNPDSLAIVSDYNGGIWYPGVPQEVLDQQIRVLAGAAHLRPKIAPSVVATQHVATAVNTLFGFGDTGFGFPFATGNGTVRMQVIHRVIVSLSVASLFVFGQAGLTVGSPGLEEIGRVDLAAGVPFTFDFGEGIEANVAAGTLGQWRAYTAAAGTLRATIVGG